jgi:hypothetical protein
MLPHTENNPSVFRQGAVYAAVPSPVSGNLLTPEPCIALRLDKMLRTPVPVATNHKYRGLALGVLARQLFYSGESHPNNGRIESLVWGVDC